MISDSNTSPIYEVYYLGGLDDSKVGIWFYWAQIQTWI